MRFIKNINKAKETFKALVDECELVLLADDVNDIELALEKQVAKKPAKNYKDSNGTTYGECPHCRHTGLEENVHDYCWWCGQKINWD